MSDWVGRVQYLVNAQLLKSSITERGHGDTNPVQSGWYDGWRRMV